MFSYCEIAFFKYSHRFAEMFVQAKKKSSVYVYLLPFYSSPSTISSCRNTWSSARRRCLARPKRIVYIRLARNCCPPRALMCNPIHSRPHNFTVSWNHLPAWAYRCSPSITARDTPMPGCLGIPAPSRIRPSYHTRRPERSSHPTACRICSSCSCTMHNCST